MDHSTASNGLKSSTNVLTPHGWMPLDDLSRGCQAIGQDGQPIVITGTFNIGIRPAFLVTFSDRTSVVCGGDQLWTVRPKLRIDKKHVEAFRSWTTTQLFENGIRTKDGASKYFLPIPEPVLFDGTLPDGIEKPYFPPNGKGLNRGLSKDAKASARNRAKLAADLHAAHQPNNLPVHPYLLGALLGDGGLTSGGIKFSTADYDMAERIRSLLPTNVRLNKVKGTKYDFSISGYQGNRNTVLIGLRALNLMGHSSLTKFIPGDYLLASISVRLELLAGLLDTDGSIDLKGNVEYSTSSPVLAENFGFLVQGLGGTVTSVTRQTTRNPSIRSYVRFHGMISSPFHLSRKRQLWDTFLVHRRLKKPIRTIASIEPTNKTRLISISTNAANGLVLIDHCIAAQGNVA